MKSVICYPRQMYMVILGPVLQEKRKPVDKKADFNKSALLLSTTQALAAHLAISILIYEADNLFEHQAALFLLNSSRKNRP
jgi:hypothetical protein